MASLGRGRRGRPWENGQPPHMFDPLAFTEAIGTAVAIIVQVSVVASTTTRTSETVGQEGRGTSRGFRHTVLRHIWEEGTRWLEHPWPLKEK